MRSSNDDPLASPEPTYTGPQGVVAAAMDTPPEPPQSYVLVFQNDTASTIVLPDDGEVLIGRAPTCNVRIEDRGVSRQHARITNRGARATVADLDSQNGTRVNGEKIVGERQLVSGDTIAIGDASIIFHTRAAPKRMRRPLDLNALGQRLTEEVDRAVRYDRPLSIIAFTFGGDAVDQASLGARAGECLRVIDVLGWGAGDLLLVLLPEVDEAEGLAVAERLLDVFRPVVSTARAGVASCPIHGCDADTLIGAARLAAGAAETGGVCAGDATTRVLVVGEHEIVIADPAMRSLYALVSRIASSELPALILGETGTGKELVAQALHAQSKRRDGPFIAVNCATLPPPLAESELFGHERGAFSGAEAAKSGLFEAAAGGTIFLDEVGELAAHVQAKLLRVLETKRVMRLGDTKERPADARVIAATHRDLEAQVSDGLFRQDLYFRLKGAQLWIPPLRDRVQELLVLARKFARDACAKAERAQIEFEESAMALLTSHAWPGNVRELKNAVEYAITVAAGPTLTREDFEQVLGLAKRPPRSTSGAPPSDGQPRFRVLVEELEELEKRRIGEAMTASKGNQTRAAQMIGMPLRTFVKKLARYGFKPAGPRA